jgi:hypothetical protein
MPVADHPVSAMTRRTGREPYGCSNAVRSPGYWVMTRKYRPDGSFTMGQEYIVDVMSTGCHYDARASDLRCAVCGVDNAKSEPTAPLLAQVGSTDGLCPGDDKGEKT